VAKVGLQIDQDALDHEWVQQPEFYHEAAVKAANARLELDDSKNELEVVRAELYFDITANPEKYKLAKTTEAAIQAQLVLCDEYKTAMEAVNTAKHKQSICDALVQACDQKKRALENLVSLRLADYYSSPKVRESDRDKVEAMEKSVSRRKGIRKE
jgi:hypothetical protein